MTISNKYVLTFLMVIFFSCHKKDEKLSTNQLLTNRSQKTWIRYSTTVDGIESLAKCDKDDEWIFSNDKYILETPGFVRCDLRQEDVKIKYFLGGPNNETIYFSTPDSSSTTIIDNSGNYLDTTYHFTRISKADIIELTENSLRYQEKIYSTYGDNVSTIITNLAKK
jgi:hypothetical protein